MVFIKRLCNLLFSIVVIILITHPFAVTSIIWIYIFRYIGIQSHNYYEHDNVFM